MSLLRVSSLSKTSIKPTAYISVAKGRFPCHIFELWDVVRTYIARGKFRCPAPTQQNLNARRDGSPD